MLTSIPKPTIRPNSTIEIGGIKVKTLFDTGSTVTLCQSKLFNTMFDAGTLGRLNSNPDRNFPELTSANGSPLQVRAAKTVPIPLSTRKTRHHLVYFVRNLQVPAIIGMDFMEI